MSEVGGRSASSPKSRVVPKSPNFTAGNARPRPSVTHPTTSALSGLTSRWQMPQACSASSTTSICSVTLRTAKRVRAPSCARLHRSMQATGGARRGTHIGFSVGTHVDTAYRGRSITMYTSAIPRPGAPTLASNDMNPSMTCRRSGLTAAATRSHATFALVTSRWYVLYGSASCPVVASGSAVTPNTYSTLHTLTASNGATPPPSAAVG